MKALGLRHFLMFWVLVSLLATSWNGFSAYKDPGSDSKYGVQLNELLNSQWKDDAGAAGTASRRCGKWVMLGVGASIIAALIIALAVVFAGRGHHHDSTAPFNTTQAPSHLTCSNASIIYVGIPPGNLSAIPGTVFGQGPLPAVISSADESKWSAALLTFQVVNSLGGAIENCELEFNSTEVQFFPSDIISVTDAAGKVSGYLAAKTAGPANLQVFINGNPHSLSLNFAVSNEPFSTGAPALYAGTMTNAPADNIMFTMVPLSDPAYGYTMVDLGPFTAGGLIIPYPEAPNAINENYCMVGVTSPESGCSANPQLAPMVLSDPGKLCQQGVGVQKSCAFECINPGCAFEVGSPIKVTYTAAPATMIIKGNPVEGMTYQALYMKSDGEDAINTTLFVPGGGYFTGLSTCLERVAGGSSSCTSATMLGVQLEDFEYHPVGANSTYSPESMEIAGGVGSSFGCVNYFVRGSTGPKGTVWVIETGAPPNTTWGPLIHQQGNPACLTAYPNGTYQYDPSRAGC